MIHFLILITGFVFIQFPGEKAGGLLYSNGWSGGCLGQGIYGTIKQITELLPEDQRKDGFRSVDLRSGVSPGRGLQRRLFDWRPAGTISRK